MTTSTLRLLCLATLASYATVPGQDPAPPTERIEWPAVSADVKKRIAFLVRKLGDADAEAAAGAESDLVAIGAGAAPILIERLGDRKLEHADALGRVLDRVVGAEFAPLLVPLFERKSDAQRVWASRRLARLAAEPHAPTFRAALTDRHPDVALHASLGLAALGDLSGMDALFARCRTDWREIAPLVGEILPRARGRKTADWVLERMPKDDENARIAGLRLLRSLAPRDYAGILETYLDADQHSVKKEAINALRAVVDGDEPLEDLSVFQAIEMAKQWRSRR